jgi:hypothetical protein
MTRRTATAVAYSPLTPFVVINEIDKAPDKVAHVKLGMGRELLHPPRYADAGRRPSNSDAEMRQKPSLTGRRNADLPALGRRNYSEELRLRA